MKPIRVGRVRFLMALVGAAAALAAIAPAAGAVVVQEANGQRAGLALVNGVNPASVPGNQAGRGPASPFSANGNLDYNGGPVLHGVTPYLVFWDPAGQISAADQALYARFFSDSAADNGKATNIWAVDRQFTDSTGFANYAQTWKSTHAIIDTQPYPTAGQCTEASYTGETACLYDSQIQAEVARLKTADGLPTGLTGHAPIYFVVTPPTVNSCFSNNSTCADNYYCAYHSSFTASAKTLLYADMPTLLAVHDPKGCQYDNNSAVQDPNARPIADVVLKAMSHEASETITDPLGNAWWNTSSGNEDGDNCNFYGSTVNPNGGSNPNAFQPYLGGTAATGTLYNQLIHADKYYIQSEWSNGDVNCKMQPTAATLTAAFTAPATAAHGTPVSFNPAGSSSSAGYTSTTWSFGSAVVFTRSGPATISHTFPASMAGKTVKVTLTVVDRYGNLKSVSHTINIT